MTCSLTNRIAAWVDGDVTQNEATALGQHLAACSLCHSTHRKLHRTVSLLQSAHPVAEPHPSTPVAQARRLVARHRRRSANWAWLSALGVTALAAGLAWAIVPALTESRPTGEFTARGPAANTDPNRKLGAEVFRHSGKGPGESLRNGAHLGAREGLSFVLYNRTNQGWHYMLFAVDARSEVHWFYPAYTAEGTNPAAPKLEPTPEVIPLPEGVLAESPATGPMRVVALFAPGEVHVSDVEKLVADGDVKKLNQVSGAVVQVLQLDVSQR